MKISEFTNIPLKTKNEDDGMQLLVQEYEVTREMYKGRHSVTSKYVKLIDLQALWPDIPEHADISDYLQHFGDGMLPKVLKLIDSTPYWKSSSEEQTANSSSIATTVTTK